MSRALFFLGCVLARGDPSCAAESSALLQTKLPTVSSEVQLRANSSSDAGWDLHDLDFGDLLASFDPQKLKDKFNKILDEKDLSFDDLAKKLDDFTTQFQDRVSQTVNQTQDKLQSMKEQLQSKGHAIKGKVLVQTADKVTKLGAAAMDVVEKVSVKVQAAREKTKSLLATLQSEQVESQKEALRSALDAAATTLSKLVASLKQALRIQPSLMQQSDPLDDVVAKTQQAVQQADELLDTAQLYIGYVNRTIVATQHQAEVLVAQIDSSTDDALAQGDAAAEQLIAKLGDLNDVLAGKVSQEQLQSSAVRAAPLLLTLWLWS